MNSFGGDWTEKKINILVEYARAYLVLMNGFAKKYRWKLLYFDGFAGSGFIEKNKFIRNSSVVGAAKRILDLNHPRSFDEYYFVEKDKKNVASLKSIIGNCNKNVHIVNTECNEKLISMAKFLKTKRGKSYRVLSYIDPCGMQLNWESLKALKQSKVDAWILVPTGIGINRLLKKDGNISERWLKKLDVFLGMNRQDVLNSFYTKRTVLTLFGEIEVTIKESEAVRKSAELYSRRLLELFSYVSNPFVLKNNQNSIMFHFFMVSNNKTAVSIANQIIEKYNKFK